MSVLDAFPVPCPGAYWPPGFREWATASAVRITAEDRAREAVKVRPCTCQPPAQPVPPAT